MFTSEELMEIDRRLSDGERPEVVARDFGDLTRGQFAYRLLASGRRMVTYRKLVELGPAESVDARELATT